MDTKGLVLVNGSQWGGRAGIGEVGTVGEWLWADPLPAGSKVPWKSLVHGGLFWGSLAQASPHPCPGVLWSIYLDFRELGKSRGVWKVWNG